MTSPRCLIVDWGGVLTGPIGEAWHAWGRDIGVDVTVLQQVFRAMGETDDHLDETHHPHHAYERGEISDTEFERHLVAVCREAGLELPDVDGGVLAQAALYLVAATEMERVVERAHLSGIQTALLSNSWGLDAYDRSRWSELFDAIVISGEVGMRKPHPEIYLHTSALLKADPTECVFVDDLPPNVRGAVAVGMIGVHHTSAETTTHELEALFDVELSGPVGRMVM